MLSLDDEPAAPAASGSDLELDMPADFDLSLADETPATPAEDRLRCTAGRGIQAELNELSSGLADELPAVQPEATPYWFTNDEVARIQESISLSSRWMIWRP